jgi:hypothetical protein
VHSQAVLHNGSTAVYLDQGWPWLLIDSVRHSYKPPLLLLRRRLLLLLLLLATFRLVSSIG